MPVNVHNRVFFNPSSGVSAAPGAASGSFAAVDVVFGGFPDATTTGWTNSPTFTGSLTTYAGPDPLRTVNSNATYTNVAFNGLTVGVIGDEVSNVTFRGCRFRSSWTDGWNVQVRGTNVRFEYCTIEPFNSQALPVTLANSYSYGIDIRGASSVTADHCDIWGFANGFQIEQSSQSLPVVVQHCYIHDAADQGGSTYHHDGLLSNNGGPSYVVMNHNRIVSGGNTNALAFQSTGTPYSNLTITNNLLGGFGYTVNLSDNFGDLNTNITFTDNVFTTEIAPIFGPFKNSWPGTAAGCLWRRNTWRVPAGSGGNAADDGKFWMPIGGVINIASPGSAVSASDYTG